MPSSCVTKFNTVSHTREERATASHRMVWRNARHAHKVCRLVRPLNVPLAIAEIELELKSLRRIHARQAHQPGYLHHAFHQTFDINERVATYSVVTELSPVKVPLAIDVFLLLIKSLQARGCARLTTSAPSVPSNCIRTNNHPQMSESRRTVG